MQASCPLMAAMCAGTQPFGVITVVSAPCHSNQCKHYNNHSNQYNSTIAIEISNNSSN